VPYKNSFKNKCLHEYIQLVLALAVCVATPYATAQPYPNRLLRIIVPSASGGAPDISARNLANELSLQLGQQVVVDNRPGANGIIGYEMIARAAPDGYTLGYITFGFAINPSMYSKLPYDSTRDFQPLMLFGSSPQVLAVTPSLPIRSVKELIELARARPGALSFGSSGVGTAQHLAMELLKVMTDTNMVHVSCKGIQQAITDVVGGQIHVVCDNVSSMLPHVRSGRVRALAVATLKRSPVVPELPTIDEAGIAGYELTTWAGYALPARAPRDLVLRLNAEINKALSSPSVSKAMADRGAIPLGGTPEQFAEHLRSETVKWAGVIKAAGIKPQ
jgi:tripartite-type tricarboxylate transporter receptor subunit TctC